jgi:hypothetical protein
VITRSILIVMACAGLAATAGASPDPLPAEPPIGGPLWSVLVPAVLFAVAFGATFLLYRHFANRDD